MSIRDFVVVTKPGIVIGNLLVAMGTYIFAVDGLGNLTALCALAVGTSMMIAGACVLNNYYDRDIDVYMRRTAKRPSVTGSLPLSIAVPYAALLVLGGSLLLIAYTNWLTASIGLLGVVTYVFVYTPAKRWTPLATLIGSLPGATPPLAGYAAAVGHLDYTAWLLFLLIVSWQMVHFYAIALFRRHEYLAAGVPVLSVVSGVKRTVFELRGYMLLFGVVVVLLGSNTRVGVVFTITMLTYVVIWLRQASSETWRANPERWGRGVFGTSLSLLLVISALLAISPLVP